MRLSALQGTRLDPHYFNPQFAALDKALNASQYPLAALKDLATAFTNGDHGGVTYTKSGVRYLRGQSVLATGLDLADELYISLVDHERVKRAEVLPGDVLLTIAGSIGNSCVMRGLERANINQAIVKIRPNSSVLPDYLNEFLNSRFGKYQTERLANGGVQLNINFSEITNLQIPLPPLDTQTAIVAELSRRRDAARQKREEAAEVWQKAKQEFAARLLGSAA